MGNIACYATNNPRGVLFTIPDTVARAPRDEFPTSWHIRTFPKWVVFQADEGIELEVEECVIVEHLGVCLHSAPRRVSAPHFRTVHPLKREVLLTAQKGIAEMMKVHTLELLGNDADNVLSEIESLSRRGGIHDTV